MGHCSTLGSSFLLWLTDYQLQNSRRHLEKGFPACQSFRAGKSHRGNLRELIKGPFLRLNILLFPISLAILPSINSSTPSAPQFWNIWIEHTFILFQLVQVALQ